MDWEKLYANAPGLFRALASKFSSEYAFTFIDARTGLSDTSGICTMLLPDVLTVVFTPNRQSLTGVEHMVRQAHAYRAQSTNIKAAYTIGDTLSRETGYITPAYMDSMFTLQQFLVDDTTNIDLRVSMVEYEFTGNFYFVRWSQGRGGPLALTNAVLATLRTQLPTLTDGDRAILTETWVGYESRYDVGLNDFVFEDLVMTRPRFAPQLCWNSSNTGGVATATC